MSDNQNKQETTVSDLDEDTMLVTSIQPDFEKATNDFKDKVCQYSAYLTESSLRKDTITETDLKILSQTPQNDLNKVMKINSLARYYINKDDLIGKVYETIESNVNADYTLSYKDVKKKKDQKIIQKAKEIIDDFNEQINLEDIIIKSVPLTYSEGNYSLYLRDKGNSYVVDSYPLGVVEVSDYEVNGEPYLLMNVQELKNRLKKINIKNKDGTYLFFKKEEDEIKKNYSKEVYNAYMKKNKYVKLDIQKSGILRINNMNRKYGITPIFRTLKPSIMLEIFEATDKINTKAKGKKIIFQKLREKLMGVDGTTESFEETQYSHETLMEAWKKDIVLYTGAPWVEDLKYVEPKVESIPVEKVMFYRSKIMNNLGISFLNDANKSTVASASISIKELMKMIDKITKQLERVIEKWYKYVLKKNNISVFYAPKIKVLDSELLSTELKFSLVDTIFNKLGASYRTSYKILGLDYENEKRLRKVENDELVDEKIFYPRMTNYTFSKKGKEDYENYPGRPPNSDDVDKQNYDKDRNKENNNV